MKLQKSFHEKFLSKLVDLLKVYFTFIENVFSFKKEKNKMLRRAEISNFFF